MRFPLPAGMRRPGSAGLFVFSLFFCVSCQSVAGLLEKGGRLLDGQAFLYKTDSVWQAVHPATLVLKEITYRDGSRGVVFRTEEIPYFTFYGGVPDKKGIFYLTRACFLAGNYEGWQEFEIGAEGFGRMRNYGNGSLAFTVPGKVRFNAVTGGKIRRGGRRLSGERALDELRSRRERIDYLAAWMRESGAPAFKTQADFEKYWSGALFRGSSDIALPPELKASWESGMLKADWDEAASWIWTFYDWNNLNLILNKELILLKARGA